MKLFDYRLSANPTIRKAINEPAPEDFQYYDKDGFELCLAEQSYYRWNDVKLDNCLNHMCCQQPWFTADNVFVDHAIILHRYDYSENAREQLVLLHHTIPQAGWLLQTKQKWGFDLALDSVTDYGQMFEVIHIEYDSHDFMTFKEKMEVVENQVARMDWQEAAKQIWRHRDQWGLLKGFEQNHWKAEFLFGWNKAEYTEKSI